jgi:hypothetical protein
VANNTLATAAVLSGLHNLLQANSWRLLLGLRAFAAEVNDKYSSQPLPAAAAAAGGTDAGLNGVANTDASGASAAAIAAAAESALQLAANTGLLKVAAAAAETAAANAAGAKNALAAAATAATAATAALTTAVASKMGVGPAELASKLAKDVLDDDTIWAAVWLRRKEMAVTQAAAAGAARGAAKPSAAAAGAAAGGSGKGLQQQGDIEMPDAADGATQQPQLVGQANASQESSQDDAADDNADGSEEPAAKKKVKLPKVMADMVEALTAAVYVDSGGDWGATWRAVSHLLLMHEGVMQELQLVLPEQKEGQQQQQQQQEPDGEAEDTAGQL